MKKTQKFWFKRKRYGYGWVPTTKEGFFVIITFLVVILSSSMLLLEENQADISQFESLLFFIIVFTTAIALIAVSYKKGPSPKWRWGKKPNDDPELDF